MHDLRRSARAALAAATRRARCATGDPTAETERVLAHQRYWELALQEHIDTILALDPPLTDEQRRRLAQRLVPEETP